LLRKDNNAAAEALRKAAELTPNDGTLFYRLGDTYDKMARATTDEAAKLPLIDKEMWYFARAVGIDGLNAAGKTQVDTYLTNVYKRVHGSDDGLQQLKDQAKATPFPPGDFHIKTKAEMAPPPPPPPPPIPIPDDITQLSFGQIKSILGEGGDRANQVMSKLKGQAMAFDGTVVEATAKVVKIAVLKSTSETDGAYDVEVTLAVAHVRPLLKGKKVEVEGTVKSYKENPVVIEMSGGKVTASAPARGSKK